MEKTGKDGSGGSPAVSDSPFDYMRQFVGASLRVTEAMGNYTVRTSENKVVLSSAFNPFDRFYCSPEKRRVMWVMRWSVSGYGQEEIIKYLH